MRSKILLVAIVALTGCITEKKRAEICATCPHTDSVSVIRKDTVIYRDTSITFDFGSDTVRIQEKCPDFKIVKKGSKGLITSVQSHAGMVSVVCEADSLKAVIKKIQKDHYLKTTSYKESEIKLACTKEHRNWLDYLCRTFSIISLVIIVIWLSLKYFKLK